MADKDIDDVSGTETTGHSWDGIKELNTPLPRWWLYTFYATIIWGIGYVIYYPAIPLIEGSTMGISGHTNRAALKDQLAAVEDGRAEIEAQIAAMPLEDIQANPDLFRYASAGGASMYKVFCSQCHGSGAQGALGFPNLNDDDWIWGGDIESIYTTIAHGVRNDTDYDARFGDMPAFGDVLSGGEVNMVANYVMSLSNTDHDAGLAQDGEQIFLDNCSGCHMENGTGMVEAGAPNLADSLWLYGGSIDDVKAQIKQPQHGVMPPWIEKLGEGKVKQLAIYIHSLGGGE